MNRCKIINALYWILPLRPIRGWLIQTHILQCPRCMKKLASASEVRSLLITEHSLETKVDLWPSLHKKLNKPQEKTKSTSFFQKRWAYAAAGILAVIVSGIVVFHSWFDHQHIGYLPPSRDFQIQYINVQNKPAHTYYYQCPDSDFVFIWAEKNKGGFCE
ncbi:MAG: hypothetical protein GF421_06570 [Candidatus Aminicenantes bacterium]|nr:hypothetical protein [Candidatus Aminicenantes bacterium]